MKWSSVSAQLISLNPDLKKLRDEGYEVGVTKNNAYVYVSHVPYVNKQKQVAYGTLVANLNVTVDKVNPPSDHVVKWVGEHPCDRNGVPLPYLVNQTVDEKINDDLTATLSFSQRPPMPYPDYYQKMLGYIRLLEGYAHAIDSNATAITFNVVESVEANSTFNYLDTATSRAGISAVNGKLKNGKIAIVGLGGTGAYVLDLLAKTPIEEIHLFDGDDFLQHNAFRYPGAPSIDELKKKQKKVDRLTEIYSKMKKTIFSHPLFIDETNVSQLNPMGFVFLCIEGANKRVIVNYLIENKIPFVDVGIGLSNQDNSLGGLVRATTCTAEYSKHANTRIDFGEGEHNEYAQNIQIADINALNAALAVIKWKKLRGFYVDLRQEHNTVYCIDTNTLTNDETANATDD